MNTEEQKIMEEFIEKAGTGNFQGRTDKVLSVRYLASQQKVQELQQKEGQVTKNIQRMNQELISTQVSIREELGRSAGVLESVVALKTMVQETPDKDNGVSKKTPKRRKK